jgi:hypothetical protein
MIQKEDNEKILTILNKGIGKSGLEDEHKILQNLLNKALPRSVANNHICPNCRNIVFADDFPFWLSETYCTNCGQLVTKTKFS